MRVRQQQLTIGMWRAVQTSDIFHSALDENIPVAIVCVLGGLTTVIRWSGLPIPACQRSSLCKQNLQFTLQLDNRNELISKKRNIFLGMDDQGKNI